RARAGGSKTKRLADAIFTFYGSYRFEGVHPLQSGVFRRKVRDTRRPGSRRENPLVFYPRRAWEIVSTYARGALYYVWLNRLRKRIERDPNGTSYTDAALAAAGVEATGAGRGVTALPGFDPGRAEDPAYLLAFKKDRARRNDEALAA